MRFILFFSLFLFPLTSQAINPAEVDMHKIVAEMSKRADAALKEYSPESTIQTGQVFSRMYFDVFEGGGMEFALGIYEKSSMLKIEAQFSRVMGLAMNGADKADLEKEWKSLHKALSAAATKHQGKHESGFWGMFWQSFLILLREGFEAMLVVTALVTYLRRSGAGDKVHVIWQGVAYALLASVLAAWLLSYVIKISGSAQEAIEGFTMLIAAAMLFYVSYWLFAKREAEKWQLFIKSQINKAVSTGSLFMLGFTAFLAVFREGAETILFYQALLAGSQNGLMPVIAGFAVATVALVVLFFVMRTASIRLPLGLFFSITAVFLFIMAFIFLGKGILELQIAGWFSSTPAAYLPELSMLGIFPTIESIGAQLLLLALAVISFIYLTLKKKPEALKTAKGA